MTWVSSPCNRPHDQASVQLLLSLRRNGAGSGQCAPQPLSRLRLQPVRHAHSGGGRIGPDAYLPAAQEETAQRFREYSPSIRAFERGIALAIDDGEFEKAVSLCDEAIGLGLGKVYAAKRASIERMM